MISISLLLYLSQCDGLSIDLPLPASMFLNRGYIVSEEYYHGRFQYIQITKQNTCVHYHGVEIRCSLLTRVTDKKDNVTWFHITSDSASIMTMFEALNKDPRFIVKHDKIKPGIHISLRQ